MSSQQFSISILLIHVLKPLLVVPKAPVIIGITTIFAHCQCLPIFLFNLWYRSTFSCPISFTLVFNGYVTSIMWHSPVYLSTIKMFGLLYSSFRLVCTEKSHSIFTLSFSSTFSSVCSYHLTAFENPYLLHIYSIMQAQAVLLFCKHFTFYNHMTDCFISFSAQSMQW